MARVVIPSRQKPQAIADKCLTRLAETGPAFGEVYHSILSEVQL
jgi:hypothetical protein